MSTDTQDPFIAEMDNAVDFLAHYGKKGMKWGVSRAASKSSSPSKSGKVKEAASDDAVRVGSIHSRVKANRSTKPLSNKELQDAITRMNLEQQYSKMTNGLDKTHRQRASEFVRGLVSDTAKGGQQIGQNYANDQVKSAVERKSGTGRFDPLTMAKREAELAKLRGATS